MNESQRASTLFIRLAFIAASSAFIAMPQILWSLYGYQGIALISLESLFIVLGFASLLCGLVEPLPQVALSSGRKLWSILDTNAGKKRISFKLAPIGILVYALYFFVPVALSRIEHYRTLPAVLEAILFILTFVFLASLVIIYFLEAKRPRSLAHWYYIPISALAITWAVAFWYGSPAYPTDEMLIDFYSAHLVMSGINPYVASNTSGVFGYIHSTLPGYPLSIGTPLLTGGLVTSISYPALSLIAYVPAHFLGLPPTVTLLPLYAIPAVMLFLTYSGEKSRLLSLFPVFILLLNPAYLIQTGLGYPDIVWVVFLMFSIYSYKKPIMSGASMGLAMAVKQIPWLIFPFFLFFVYRELGRKEAIYWALFAALAFLLPNVPFILNNPASFFQAILAPGFDPLMGIGFGPSQLGFLGIAPLSREFFTVVVICLSASFLMLYIVYYDRLKLAFLAFPLLIFLFNYRFLLDYVVFWPIIALIVPAMIKISGNDTRGSSKRISSFPGRNKAIAICLAILLLGVPIAYHESHSQPNGLSIGNINIGSSDGQNITAITLNLGLVHTNVSYGQVMYRIVPWSQMPNLNGYLWHFSNLTLENNSSATITLVPDNSLQQIPVNGKYRIIAYYGDLSSTMSFTVSQGKVS